MLNNRDQWRWKWFLNFYICIFFCMFLNGFSSVLLAIRFTWDSINWLLANVSVSPAGGVRVQVSAAFPAGRRVLWRGGKADGQGLWAAGRNALQQPAGGATEAAVDMRRLLSLVLSYSLFHTCLTQEAGSSFLHLFAQVHLHIEISQNYLSINLFTFLYIYLFQGLMSSD